MKSNLKDPSDPDSYRAIAGSSLVLKTFELVILNLWGNTLSSDSLQFGYKSRTSTTHCTWLASEVVQHMLRAGVHPIVTVLDCSKAFDKCKFSLLFTRLLDKGLPPVVVRVMAFVYMEQYGWVRWGDSRSSQMSISNGTRQGAILSPLFWAVYADPLLRRLRDLGLGAHIAGLFVGAVCYCDDVLLIAPTRSAMQRMLLEMEDQDSVVMRAKFIQSAVETKEVFKWAAPAEILKAMKIYCNSFYGSSLWELEGEKAMQVYRAWSTAVKHVWGCPQWTRSFLMQQVLSCGFTSAKVEILSRYVRFFRSLLCSTSKEVRVLSRLYARDVRSVTGKNLQYISEITGLNPWTVPYSGLKTALITEDTVQVPEQDRWRVPYLCSLLRQRGEAHHMAMEEDNQRSTELINSLVAN